MFEVLKDGTVKTTELSWNISENGGMLNGVKEMLEGLEHGGYVVLAPGGANRTFLFNNLLGSADYASGIFDPATITGNPYEVKAVYNFKA